MSATPDHFTGELTDAFGLRARPRRARHWTSLVKRDTVLLVFYLLLTGCNWLMLGFFIGRA